MDLLDIQIGVLNMSLNKLKNKWLDFVRKLNSNGIPVPLVRDPKLKTSSVSLTLVFISFNVWLVSVVGKASGFFGGVNPDQAFNMFMACATLYFGRNLTFNKDDKQTEVEEKKDE